MVSHGAALRSLVAHVLGASLAQLHRIAIGGNTALSIVQMDHGALRLVSYNDTAHLDAGFQVSNAKGAGPGGVQWKEQANEHRKPIDGGPGPGPDSDRPDLSLRRSLAPQPAAERIGGGRQSPVGRHARPGRAGAAHDGARRLLAHRPDCT